MSLPIDYCGEGPVDAAVARRLIEAAGGKPGTDYVTLRGRRGKDAFDKRMSGLVSAAHRGRRVLVLRDLDAEPCAGPVIARLVRQPPPPGFCLRLAVRAVEAWLLADHDGIARGLKIPKSGLPRDADAIADPKGALRRLGQQSREDEIKEQSVATPQVFGALTAALATEVWDPERAAARSPSLARALMRLRAACR